MYSVTWQNEAMDRLVGLMLRSDQPTQDVLERAVLRLNARLARSPRKMGESRPDGRRIAFEPPVAVLFDVDEPTRTVRVANFWTY